MGVCFDPGASALGLCRRAVLRARVDATPLDRAAITAALGDAIGSGVRWQDSLALLRVAEHGGGGSRDAGFARAERPCLGCGSSAPTAVDTPRVVAWRVASSAKLSPAAMIGDGPVR